MDDATRNPLARFSDRADLYARCRPKYPDAAIDYVIRSVGLTSESLLVDVGSGTGIAARQFAERGIRVIGIEPNEKMRRHAEAAACSASVPPEYRTGQAENTGLSDTFTDAVLAAQAFHWFQPEAALREFHRILKPRGWVALMWNERDERDAFTAAYGEALLAAPNAAEIERERASAGMALLQTPLFPSGEHVTFTHSQELDEDAVLGRVFSTSYAPTDPTAATELAEALKTAFRRFQANGRVRMHYETSIYAARRD